MWEELCWGCSSDISGGVVTVGVSGKGGVGRCVVSRMGGGVCVFMGSGNVVVGMVW